MFRQLDIKSILIYIVAPIVLVVLIWQGITYHGNPPDPTEATSQNMSPTTMGVNAGILVFREGLEAILVLSALTAGLIRTKKRSLWRPIATGAGLGFAATLATWFLFVAIISIIPASELDIQAGAELLAILVLLIVMNWFFHRIYWTGWIGLHNKKKKSIIENSEGTKMAAFMGLALLGFSAVYREGFETVLFLQNLRLKAGSEVILYGAGIGLFLTLIVGTLTFVVQRKLPYKKMLVLTGVLLGVVLVIMVGESAQDLQDAGWIPTTELNIPIPGWLGMWFAIFPTAQGLIAQALAVLLVLGSYAVVEYKKRLSRRKTTTKQRSVN